MKALLLGVLLGALWGAVNAVVLGIAITLVFGTPATLTALSAALAGAAGAATWLLLDGRRAGRSAERLPTGWWRGRRFIGGPHRLRRRDVAWHFDGAARLRARRAAGRRRAGPAGTVSRHGRRGRAVLRGPTVANLAPLPAGDGGHPRAEGLRLRVLRCARRVSFLRDADDQLQDAVGAAAEPARLLDRSRSGIHEPVQLLHRAVHDIQFRTLHPRLQASSRC